MDVEETMAALTAKIEALEAAQASAAQEPETKPDQQGTAAEDAKPDDDEAPGWFRKFWSRKQKPGDKPDGDDAEPAKTEPDKPEEPEAKPAPASDDKIGEALLAIAQRLEDIDKRVGYVDTDARNRALDQLGVDPRYREFVPDFDPRSEEGLLAAEKFVAEHVAIAPHRRPPPVEIDVDKLPDVPYGPSKQEQAATLAKINSQDWRVER